ncbi:MAG: hypothetical protein IAF38_04765, partial [Bacteroidia bacterium]|nr:hypothetical protein [Bacteroidia bacterium]
MKTAEEIDLEIERVEDLLNYLEKKQHTSLKRTINQVEADLRIAEKQGDHENEKIATLEKTLHEVRTDVTELIKMEERMIFPHIRSLLTSPGSKTTYRNFHNLSSPVRTLIIKHHHLLDKIRGLL